MAWECAERGPAAGYYYASVRTPAGVRKVYLGRGAAGHEAAAAIERARNDRRAAAALLAAARADDRDAADLRAWAAALGTAWLVLAGFHRHRGCWRRNRHG